QYYELKAITLGCIGLLESHYHKAFTEAAGGKKAEANHINESKENFDRISKQVTDISTSIKALAKEAPELQDEIQHIVAHTQAIEENFKVAHKDFEQLASQATIYRGLATIGITASVFGHETKSSIDLLSASLKLATISGQKHLGQSTHMEVLLRELDKARKATTSIGACG